MRFVRILFRTNVLISIFVVTLATAPLVVWADVQAGEKVYLASCFVCHGTDGKGAVPGAPNFQASDGPLAKPGEELLKNVRDGFQSPGSPMAMPAKGGNPNLTEQQLADVLEYIRRTFGSK